MWEGVCSYLGEVHDDGGVDLVLWSVGMGGCW